MSTQFPRVIVGALIFDSVGKLFLMRSSGKFGDQWIIPGGKVDFGEKLEDGLRREIREETNLQLDSVCFLGIRELVEPCRHFVFLEYSARALNPTDVRLNEEATEHVWVARNDLNKLSIAPSTLQLIEERWQ